MYLVSLPVYVKVIHLRSFSGVWSGGSRLRLWCVGEGIGKELLRRIL
jgi:hypothetical protein